MFMDLELLVAEEFAANFLDSRGSPGSGDELRRLIKAVYAEVQQGATIRHTLQVVAGRKPRTLVEEGHCLKDRD